MQGFRIVQGFHKSFGDYSPSFRMVPPFGSFTYSPWAYTHSPRKKSCCHSDINEWGDTATTPFVESDVPEIESAIVLSDRSPGHRRWYGWVSNCRKHQHLEHSYCVGER